MQVKKVPPALGWRWVVEGFTTFLRAPAVVTVTGVLLFFTLLLTSALPVPLLGPVVPLLIAPALSFGFAQVTREVLAGRRPSPFLLYSGLGPKAVGIRRELLILGAINVTATMIAMLVARLIDDGSWTEMLVGDSPAEVPPEVAARVLSAMLLFMVVYAPFQAVFWFAPLFAGMHRVPAIRSIFFSAVSVWRNKLPLFGYFTGWLVFAVVWGLVVRTVAMLLLPSIGPTLLPVAMVLLMVLVYSSYWPTYRDIVDPPPDTLPTPAN